MPVYEWVAGHLGACLGCETQLVVGSSYDQLTNGEVDVAFLCGWPYVRLADLRPSAVEILAAPVLAGRRYDRRPIYFSDVIVRADRPFKTFADLRGGSWSYNEPASYSGHLATLDHLLSVGATNGFFGQVVEAGWHEASIRMVSAGVVDASAVDSQVLSVAYRQDRELRSRLRIIATFRSAPIQPVVAGRHLPASVREALRVALLAAAFDPVGRTRLAEGGVDHLVSVDDRYYDPIRHRDRAVRAARLTRIR